MIVIGHNLLVKSQLLREKIVHQAYGWPPVRAIQSVSSVIEGTDWTFAPVIPLLISAKML